MILSRVGIYNKFGVASEHPLASISGFKILERGGNAADAGFAVSFALSVLQHQLGGLGGDFLCFYLNQASDKIYCLNSTGWSFSNSSVRLIKEKGFETVPQFGVYSVVVPGIVKGIYELHSKFGKMNPRTLLGDAINFAYYGFPVTRRLANSISLNYENFSKEAKEIFGKEGRPLRVGEKLVQKELGNLLVEISKSGPSAFYEGRIADSIIKTINSKEQICNSDDFASFKPEWQEPLQTVYEDYIVYEMPANTMGPITIDMIKRLKELKDDIKPNSTERVESFVRIATEAYDLGMRILGDPRFLKNQVSEELKGSTTSFCIADDYGNLLVAIQSLYHHFGSRVFVPEAGIFLNNRGSSFKLNGPNQIEPRKRPLHTLSTCLLKNRGRIIGFGTSGGEFRPQLHSLFITNIVKWKMSLEEAIDYPRFLLQGNKIIIEKGYEKVINDQFAIEERQYPSETGVAAGIEISEQSKKFVCDVRGDGIPAGY